ncbi:MAG: DUF1634 domain-containing protein [Bacteroidales bacterium]|nr:DUF1634 domain-containing protein [Bacteroidales bacterium]
MNNPLKPLGEHGFQTFIGWQLRVGVLLAIVLAVVGLVMLLIDNHAALPDLSYFSAEVVMYSSAASLWQGVWTGEATALMQLAVGVLILTPLLRIVCSLIAFVIERDWLYVGITAMVALIVASTIVMGVAY